MIMKTSNKLLIALPVLVLMAIALCLEIAGEYKEAGVVPVTGSEVKVAGRVPAFSIITIKGRAFTTQKPASTETEKEAATYTTSDAGKHRPGLLPMAFQMITRSVAGN
jgi:hypothetical protein